jgi:hypothetical protein
MRTHSWIVMALLAWGCSGATEVDEPSFDQHAERPSPSASLPPASRPLLVPNRDPVWYGSTEVYTVGHDGAVWYLPYLGERCAYALETHVPCTDPAQARWQSLGGRATNDVARDADGALYVRGIDGALWTGFLGGAADSRWTSLGGRIAGTPFVTAMANALQIAFARAPDGSVVSIRQGFSPTSTSFGWESGPGWENLGGRIRGNPVAALSSDGSIQVFARGTDDELYSKTLGVDERWDGRWVKLGQTITSDPAVVKLPDGSIALFARGSDGSLVTMHQSSWTSLGGGLASGPTVVLGVDDFGAAQAQVYVLGTNPAGALYRIRQAGDGWGSWELIGGALQGTPSVAFGDVDGAPYLADLDARASQTLDWTTLVDGRWTPFSTVGSP